ncbi:MAG TPA: hypothetical protein VH599_10355 [Ktedonobacterales bacterium]
MLTSGGSTTYRGGATCSAAIPSGRAACSAAFQAAGRWPAETWDFRVQRSRWRSVGRQDGGVTSNRSRLPPPHFGGTTFGYRVGRSWYNGASRVFHLE